MFGIVGSVLFLLDFVLLIVGVWTLVKGSLPQGLLEKLFGKGNYHTNLRAIYIIGTLLVAPFLGFILTVVILTMIGEAAINVASLNFLLSISIVLIVVVWVRRIKKSNIV